MFSVFISHIDFRVQMSVGNSFHLKFEFEFEFHIFFEIDDSSNRKIPSNKKKKKTRIAFACSQIEAECAGELCVHFCRLCLLFGIYCFFFVQLSL